MMLHQHGLNRAILRHLREAMPDTRVDLLFDGYDMPADRPLIIVEPMQNTNSILTKRREAIQTIYRYQIGLFDENSVQLSKNQERLQQVLNFDEIAFYDTLQETMPLVGYFSCFLMDVVPMPNDDASRISDNHRVYFDVEIYDVKRRGN